jgi:peptide/nickel transport system ATP-binding protein
VTPFLEVDDLSVSLPTRAGTLKAIDHVSFSVAAGETLCLVGESGCGKSMTALALMGLLPSVATRTASRIRLGQDELTTLPPRQLAKLRGERIAMVFQEPMTALNPVFTVGDQLTTVFRQHRPVSAAAARDRAVEMLTLVGISSPDLRLRQYPHELSGGLRQRVLIAMALMCDPKLLIADEPTTALDVTIQADLLRLLAELRRKLGMAMILITHDLGVVSRIADRVAVMYAGQVVEEGTVREVFEASLHPYTRGLMACLPGSRTARELRRLPAIPGNVPSLIGDHRGCRFRDRCSFAGPECEADIPLHGGGGRPHPYRCILSPDAVTGRKAGGAHG